MIGSMADLALERTAAIELVRSRMVRVPRDDKAG
jgi:hypothetical protein